MSGRPFDFLIAEPVRAVRDSLDADADQWCPYYIGGALYTLTHNSGINIWTQNRPYALEIKAPDGSRAWGGFAFPGLGPSRWSLLFAILRWERKHPIKAAGNDIAAILRGDA